MRETSASVARLRKYLPARRSYTSIAPRSSFWLCAAAAKRPSPEIAILDAGPGASPGRLNGVRLAAATMVNPSGAGITSDKPSGVIAAFASDPTSVSLILSEISDLPDSISRISYSSFRQYRAARPSADRDSGVSPPTVAGESVLPSRSASPNWPTRPTS